MVRWKRFRPYAFKVWVLTLNSANQPMPSGNNYNEGMGLCVFVFLFVFFTNLFLHEGKFSADNVFLELIMPIN